MKRPNNILETKEYVEPHTFDSDQEAILFYAYVEQEKYIDELEKQLLIQRVVKSFYCWNEDCGMEKCNSICISCEKYKGNGIKQ